ncbi:MAG TPA: transglutaminase domain-containing protein [Ktedonobacteraceae bacterium]
MAQPRLKLVPTEGWLPMVLLAVAVYVVISSIIASGWVNANTNLLMGAAAGLLVGFLVAKTNRFPQVILHLGACLAGYWLSVFLTSMAYHVSWLLLLQNLRAIISGGLVSSFASGGDMVFLFYLTFLSFFLGYFGAWLIYRAHLPWLVALIYCSIMLVNLQYARSDLSLLVVALVGALLLLIARMHLNNQLVRWSQEGLHTDRTWLRSITTRFTWVAALMTALILPVSMILPVVDQPTAGVSLWNGIDNFWTNITNGQFSLDNPGSAFQPYQPATNFFSNSLSITGNVNLPTGQVLYYSSTSGSQPHYLEGFTYDYFDGHTWTSHAGDRNVSYGANATLPAGVIGNFSQVTTTVTMVNPPGGDNSYIFAPDVPNSFSVPTTLSGPDGMTTAWTQQTPFSAGERYLVISNIPAISPPVLSAIPLPGVDATVWTNDNFYSLVSNYYLQTPADLSPRVMQTLKSWTSGARDAYDAMNMLVAHFTNQAQFAYSVSNPPVPSNIDAVSWLLQTHRGYCTYYATAMTIMARSLGIPARVVSGFSQGHYDASRHVWEVDGTNAHSWVQVYFPAQGWVNFDPTPGFSLNNTNNPQPTPTTGTSPTPTKPVPTATGTHPRPGNRPTPSAGSSNTGGNTPGASNGTSGMLFLDFSLVLLIAALLALVVAGYRYRLKKLYANIPIISHLYWRVSRLASLSGAEPRPSQTPYEYTRMLCQRFPRAQAALWHITHLFVRERWGARQHLPRETEVQDVERLWPTVRNAMLRSWPGRLRAYRRNH